MIFLSYRLNQNITIHEFKRIFYMEWGHRILGRVIGVAFVAPLAYFALRKKLTASLPVRLTCMAGLIGFQGFLGWYMVKSGLEQSLLDIPGAVPRVSQYRLSAHLGTALVLYAGMLSTGLSVIRDWKYANGGRWSGTKASAWRHVLGNRLVKSFTRQSWALSMLVLLTALSGMQFLNIQYIFLNSCRRLCGWFRCRAFIQRVPPHGGPHCAPFGRTLRHCVRKKCRWVRLVVEKYIRESYHGSI
jgi:heme A synthase